MRYFPVFLSLERRLVVVSGAGETAASKLRLLLKTPASVAVFGVDPDPQVADWARSGRIRLSARRVEATDIRDAALLYCANDERREDERARSLGRQAGVPVNVVDNLAASDFITPAIVDRDPVTVAIGTEGTSPTLARRVKSLVEELLPSGLGAFAAACFDFRQEVVDRLSSSQRRAFWKGVFRREGPGFAYSRQAASALEAALQDFIDRANGAAPSGSLHFVGTGPGKPELMSLLARQCLEHADTVIHDNRIPEPILELARREAFQAPAANAVDDVTAPPAKGIAFAIERAVRGENVVWLTRGDPLICGNIASELQAAQAAGVSCLVVPGIPTHASREMLQQVMAEPRHGLRREHAQGAPGPLADDILGKRSGRDNTSLLAACRAGQSAGCRSPGVQ